MLQHESLACTCDSVCTYGGVHRIGPRFSLFLSFASMARYTDAKERFIGCPFFFLVSCASEFTSLAPLRRAKVRRGGGLKQEESNVCMFQKCRQAGEAGPLGRKEGVSIKSWKDVLVICVCVCVCLSSRRCRTTLTDAHAGTPTPTPTHMQKHLGRGERKGLQWEKKKQANA